MNKSLEEKIKTSNQASNLKKIECKVCKNNFKPDKELKQHIVNAHPKTLKCNHCDKFFEKAGNWRLFI